MSLNKQYLLLLIGLLLGGSILAQNTVSGIVTDAVDNTPLIGVTVGIKDKADGGITDIDGRYELSVEGNDVKLVFSYVGYETFEIDVNGQSEINVSLQPTISDLEEIVVVGYGTQKKSVVTGAIAKVKAEDLENMPVTRIEQSLQGRTSGVRVTTNSGQPGAGSVVRIRGTTTTGNSDPVYVVDGVIIGGGIDYLAQGDIESIEVLKDASASIYGARSANGVILVTTKKGESGKARVTYNGYYGSQNPWRKLALLNATEYGTLLNEASAAAGQPILFEDPTTLGEGTDWQDAVFNENAPIQNHELSISSATDRSSYYASFSYFDQEGIVSDLNSRFKRFSARINTTQKIGERIKIGNNIGYTRINGRGVSENSEFGSPLSRAINIDPITPLYETDPDVLGSNVYQNFPVVRDENGFFGISQYVTSEVVNPVAALEVQHGFGWSDKVVGNLFAEVDLLPGLKFKSSIGTDLAFWGGEGFTPVYYLNATNVNDITSYSRSQNRGLYWIFENTVTYEKRLGDHSVSTVVGSAADKTAGRGSTGIIQDIPVNDIEDASLLWANDPALQAFFGFEYESRTASLFGRINYNYAEKYLLSFIYRRDGSSKFGINNRFGHFPSVSAGWVLTQEDFFPSDGIVKFLKFRGSWGISGNDRINDHLFLALVRGGRSYTFGVNDNLVNGVAPSEADNPDLRWEETEQFNIGLDSRLFRHFSLTVDYFEKTSHGILNIEEVPGLFGVGSPTGNVAKLNNKGFELELGYNNKVGQLNIEFDGNISYVKNEIDHLTNESNFEPGQRYGPQGLEITRTTVGFPIGHFFGFKTDGLFQTQEEINNYVNSDGELIQPDASPGDIKFLDTNEDGLITNEDRTYIGDPTPSWTYGFNLALEYKGFDLLLFGQGVFGNEIYNVTRRFDLPLANYEASALGRWTGPNTSNDFPRLVLNDPNGNFSKSSDFFLQNGAFFRIKTLQIGYNLPKNVLDKVGLTKARFYVSGNNLLTITDYKGFDPEIGAGSGVDRGIYPQARFYLVGTSISF